MTLRTVLDTHTPDQGRHVINGIVGGTYSPLAYVARPLNSSSSLSTPIATADGTVHPLSERFATLADAQAMFPFVTSLSEDCDTTCLRAMIRDAVANRVDPLGTKTGPRVIQIPAGRWKVTMNSIFTDFETTKIEGMIVRGEGFNSTFLELTPPAGNTTPWYFYKTREEVVGAVTNTYAMRYAIFEDICFQGVLNDPYCNGFRFTTNAGFENGVQFNRCRLIQMDTVCRFDGWVNSDSHRFFHCRIRNVRTAVLHLNNLNSLSTIFTGCQVEVIQGDIVLVDNDTTTGTGGGSEVMFVGGSLMLLDFDNVTGVIPIPEGDPAYLIRIKEGSTVSGNYIFQGVKVELHGAGARMVKVENTNPNQSQGSCQIIFRDSNFIVSNGAPRRMVELTTSNKSVHFENCALPNNGTYHFVGDASTGNIPVRNQGVPGQITFSRCQMPRGIWSSTSASDADNRYSIFELQDCYRPRDATTNNITTIQSDGTRVTISVTAGHGVSHKEYVQIEGTGGLCDGIFGPVDLDTAGNERYSFSFAHAAAVTTLSNQGRIRYLDVPLSGLVFNSGPIATINGRGRKLWTKQMGFNVWPQGLADNLAPWPNPQAFEKTAFIPAGAIIKSIHIQKVTRQATLGLAGNTVQYVLTNNDKTYEYGRSLGADQNLQHEIHVNDLYRLIATTINEQILRLSVVVVTGSLVAQTEFQAVGDFGLIEYY